MLPNSRVLRIVLYVVVGILFLGAVTWDAARRFGVNPFEGNTILYWGLVFLVGIYVIARIAMILERHQKGRGQSNVGRRKNSILSMFSGADLKRCKSKNGCPQRTSATSQTKIYGRGKTRK